MPIAKPILFQANISLFVAWKKIFLVKYFRSDVVSIRIRSETTSTRQNPKIFYLKYFWVLVKIVRIKNRSSRLQFSLLAFQ